MIWATRDDQFALSIRKAAYSGKRNAANIQLEYAWQMHPDVAL
jgi:hypothetical protein